MRNHMFSSALIAALVTVAASAAMEPAQAQTRAAPPQANRSAQEAACSGDATRFCGEAIPDEQKIAACLRANRTRISQACQAMLK